MSEIILTIKDVDLSELFGKENNKLNILKNAHPEVSFTARGEKLKLIGEKKKTQNVKSQVEMMVKVLKDQKELSKQAVEEIVLGDNPYKAKLTNGVKNATILHGKDGKPIKARTINQKRMIELVAEKDIVFAIGPAGTGKTYTAVALAVKALKNRVVKKIILTRPAVEAGESLGFLPGDLKEKIDPYLRPLYDALGDMLPDEKLEFFMNNQTIEVAPLAYMRGRTLDNAFIILDEAQNTSSMQIKMFLTRLGPSAKCIITGDLSQIDLPRSVKSGLRKAIEVLGDIKGIGKVFLTADDVVRHRLVKQIINAYEKDYHRQEKQWIEQKKEESGKTE